MKIHRNAKLGLAGRCSFFQLAPDPSFRGDFVLSGSSHIARVLTAPLGRNGEKPVVISPGRRNPRFTGV
jgi:hypothetical protein